MNDSLKYLIHARITADGVVDRTDVVGAIFGQTEGLLGNELDIRGLQESERLGRLDVEVESENGHTFGRLTIGSGLDKVETAILAAALETIEQIGPCTASVEVTGIEDLRTAKRRAIIERAKELLATDFDDATLSSAEIVDEVRESTQAASVAEFAGLPAGSAVGDGNAVIIVEGRADVRRLLEFDINNVVAVEGTNIPDAVADLTRGRTTTAFLDGDRGGDLILRELVQVGDIDYVARAPPDKSVEDLSREEVTTALREKRSLEHSLGSMEESPASPDNDASGEPDGFVDSDEDDSTPASTDGAGVEPESRPDYSASAESVTPGQSDDEHPTPPQESATEGPGVTFDPEPDNIDQPTPPKTATTDRDEPTTDAPKSVLEHAAEIIGSKTGAVRLLSESGEILDQTAASDIPTTFSNVSDAVSTVIVDGTVGQAEADAAASADVDRVVARKRGSFVKRPAAVRIHTWAEVQASEEPPE